MISFKEFLKEVIQEGVNFNEYSGRAVLDKRLGHEVEWRDGAGEFAKHYIRFHKGEKLGAKQSDLKHREKFWTDHDISEIRSGFAGSGTTIYKHKKTGRTFEVNREPNGKGFYGTTHFITKFEG